jgi:hypothetical protein
MEFTKRKQIDKTALFLKNLDLGKIFETLLKA